MCAEPSEGLDGVLGAINCHFPWEMALVEEIRLVSADTLDQIVWRHRDALVSTLMVVVRGRNTRRYSHRITSPSANRSPQADQSCSSVAVNHQAHPGRRCCSRATTAAIASPNSRAKVLGLDR